MLTLLAVVPAKAGCSHELGQGLLALVQQSRGEEGNINYDVHQSNDDPDMWMMYENWSSQEALDAHFEQPYMKEFIARLPQLMAGELRLQKFTQVSPPGA